MRTLLGKRMATAMMLAATILIGGPLWHGFDAEATAEATLGTTKIPKDRVEEIRFSAAPAATVSGEVYGDGETIEKEKGSISEVETKKDATPKRPIVYITFDDGPSDWTPQVLDILKEHGVKATFFVLGELAAKREETVRRIVSEGHALGNHTYDHQYEDLYRDFWGFWEQVLKTDETLTRITGERVRLLRAPGGTYTNFDARYFSYLQEAGYRIHDWNLDAGDSRRRGVPAEEIVRNVKRSKLTREVNLLLHDGAGHKETVKALPEMIRYFKDKGYSFEVLTEEVEPIVFPVGKVKWDRNVNEDQHARILTAIRDAQSPPEEQGWIGLRHWAAGKGEVSWDTVSETAAFIWHDEIIRFTPKTGEAERLGDDGTREPVHLAFKLENDRLFVSKAQADAMMEEYEGKRVESLIF